MRFGAHAPRRVGDSVDLVAFARGLDRRHGQTDFRPERRHDQLLAAGLLHRLDDARVFPGVDEGAVDRLLVGEHVLQALDELAAAVLQHRGQDRRHVENLRCLRQRDDVVHDHRRLVAVQVGELEGLVVDQDQDQLLGGEEGVEAVLAAVDWVMAFTPVWVAVVRGVDIANLLLHD